MNDSFYITTPIYYVNDKPHIGHAYTTILADVLARYHRLLDEPTWFLTGTDEHGQKVERAAKKNNMSCQEQADRTVVNFQELWQQLEITHDDFIRTTEPRHQQVVQNILQDLWDRGEIYKDSYAGWYSVSEERFFTEKELIDGKDPISGRPVEWIEEDNYFFKMSNYQEWLIQYIEDNPEFIQPDFRRNETLGFLRQPLNDLCISRPKSRLPWGIELPFAEDYVCYVWFDALVNYISAIGYSVDDKQFQQWWPATYQLIGKDILTTHTVYWPTMLKAMGAPLPKTVFAHGWWLVDEEKMSKTTGNVVDPKDFSDRYGTDAFRYHLIAEMTLGNDANFSELSFAERYNNDLADGVGNMLSRVAKMIEKNCDGKIPEPGPLAAEDEELKAAVMAAVPEMEAAIHGMRLDRGLQAVMEAVRACNRYFEKTTPWTLVKSGETERLHTVLYTAAEALRIVAGLLYPVLPGKMTDLRLTLGLGDEPPKVVDLKAWGTLPTGATLGKSKPLFPKVDIAKLKEDIEAAKAADESADDEPDNVVDLIEIDDFFKVQLKTARVLQAEPVKGKDRILLLQIEVGKERRQIVAGVAQHYQPEELVGRTIVVVANLKPAKIAGLKSQGMLLAAKSGKNLNLVTVDGDVPSGVSIG